MEQKLPLGLIKQVCLKLDSIVSDLYEIRDDSDIDNNLKEGFNVLADTACRMEANILNLINNECDIDEFMNENVPMDEIGEWPQIEEDILEEVL